MPVTITAKKFKQSTKQTANGVTAAVVNYLNLQGHHVRRTNNHATFDIKRAGGVVLGMIKSKYPLDITGIIQRLRSCYNKGTAEAGLSDITGYTRRGAQYIAIEVKIGNDKLSMAQRKFLDSVRNCGGIAMVVKSFDDFEKQWESMKVVNLG